MMGGEAVMKKVAAILNISEDTLKSAFQKAAEELRTASFSKALDRAVANGKITRAEADQIETWWSQRPAALNKLAPDGGSGMWSRMRGGMMRFHPRLSGAGAR